jgi:hypothetical protein
VTRANGEMSQRPYKVEQWSKGFAGVTKLILDAADPNNAHAEFERVVSTGREVGTLCEGECPTRASSDTAAEMMCGPPSLLLLEWRSP